MPTSSKSPHTVAIALTTIGADADAAALARALVHERLAACVNILPAMMSVYRWKGEVSEDREHQMIIKTTVECLDRLTARLRDLHPYELPEMLVIPVTGGSGAYLDWVKDSTA